MPKQLASFLKYTLMLMVSAFLLWLSFSNMEVGEDESKIDYLLNAWNIADKKFLLLSGAIAIFSHFIRGVRWKLMLSPLGYNVKTLNSFLSVMIGYFINLVIPRGGEVSRCYNIYKLEKVPVDTGLGTVIAERVIDLIILLLFILASFLIEFDNLVYFFSSLDLGGKTDGGSSKILIILIFLLLIFIVLLTAAYTFFKLRRYKALRLWSKIKGLIKGLKDGVLVIFRLEKNILFIFYSVLIWFCYYVMTYCVMMAFTDTEQLGLIAAVSVFAVGGIAMTIPLPGGTGSYHVLVPLALVILYGLSREKAIAFTFIFHAWQTLVIIVFGLASLLMVFSKAIKTNNNGTGK